MALSSIEFIALLPPLVAIYWLLWNQRLRQVWIAVATALFVAFPGRFHLLVLLAVLAGTSIVIAVANRAPGTRQLMLRGGIAGLLLVLAYFKYVPWLASLLSLPVPAISQPLGISYYTFILIGFLADAGQRIRHLPSSRVPWLVMFFPFLLSGPIVRLRSWSAQVSPRRKRGAMRQVTIGAHLFLVGALKKVLIADAIAVSTGPVWATPTAYGQMALAMALVGFYVQLYADFSGYTDMARGVARMMGFHLPINFKAPYFATTPMDFWSRWHMSLTGWIRDYVFTPLSVQVWRRVPSRRLAPPVTFALVVVLMTLVGLWHGASNNFVLFGMVHGILIGAWYSVVGNGRRLGRRQRVVSWVLFQLLLMISMTMFRASSIDGAYQMVSGLLGSGGSGSIDEALAGLLIACAAIYLFQRGELTPGRRLAALRGDVRLFPLFVVLILGVVYMKGLTLEGVWISPTDPFFNQGQEKFIYLQF